MPWYDDNYEPRHPQPDPYSLTDFEIDTTALGDAYRTSVKPNQLQRSSMRTIKDHKVLPNDPLTIRVTDEPGPGGANHQYQITGFDDPQRVVTIGFQKGPIKENGVNDLTHEVLLAIVIDRLRSFQAGPYACGENEAALTYVQSALGVLKRRTIERMNRGVEGTSTK